MGRVGVGVGRGIGARPANRCRGQILRIRELLENQLDGDKIDTNI